MILSMARALMFRDSEERSLKNNRCNASPHWLVAFAESFITPCLPIVRASSQEKIYELIDWKSLDSVQTDVYFSDNVRSFTPKVIDDSVKTHFSYKSLRVDTSRVKGGGQKELVAKTLERHAIPARSGFDDYFVDHGDSRIPFMSPSERSRSPLYSQFALDFQNKSFELVKELCKYLEDKDGYHGLVSLLQQSHGKTILKFPGIDHNKVIKFSHDKSADMETRFENTARARHFCRDAGLDRLVIPVQIIINVHKLGQKVIIEQRLDIDPKPLSGDRPEDLELLRQFMIFVRYSGYWDITPQNNPYTGDNKLALLDLESLKTPEWRIRDSGGFYLHHEAFTRSNQKERAFFKDYSPAQIEVMQRTLKKHDLDIVIEE